MFDDGIYSQGRWGVSVPYVPPAAIADVSIAPGSDNEGNSGTTSRTVTVTLDAAAPVGGSSVAWAVTGIGANPASAADFQGGVFPSGTINITAGNTTGTATINIVGDTTVETDETFRVTISSPVNCILGVSAVDATIVNDDVSSLSVTATVESNGWVLAIRGTWTATPGAFEFSGEDRTNGRFASSGTDQFPLDPSGTPKIALAVQDAGFDRIGGQAVANSNRPRTVVATKPLRKVFPNQAQLDEFDHGDGTRTIRFALSERIYSTSVITTASFLSGWKAGQAGGATASITNSSTITAPLPLFRWACEPWQLVQGTVGTPFHMARVELVGGSHHIEASGSDLHQSFAAVKLVAYDGTTSKAFWFDKPYTSPQHGDSLRCWGGEIDLSGLNPGGITVHAEVFPWVGASRATGTAPVTSRSSAIFNTWGSPVCVTYDPTGVNYPVKYVHVDFASTNTDGTNATHRANVTLFDTPAAAKAAATANKPANIMMAAAALGTFKTEPAANGFTADANCVAYMRIILPSGTHTISQTLTSSLARTGQGFLVVMGDPDDPNARTNTFVRAGAASYQPASINRWKWERLTIELGTRSFFNATLTNKLNIFSNVTIQAVPGQQSAGQTMWPGSDVYDYQFNTSHRDLLFQLSGVLLRNVQRTAAVSTSLASAMINVTINTPAGGDYAPDRTATAFGANGGSIGDDAVIWGCRVYDWENGGSLISLGTGNFGADVNVKRLLIVNSLIEGEGKLLSTGETNNSQLRDSLIDGFTLVGGRWNFHNDCDRGGTASYCAIRVAGTTTITIGLLAHGLASGDTITTTGMPVAAMNRTNVAVTVLDANRFTYVASATVSSVASAASGSVTIVNCVATPALNGTTRAVNRENLRHTGNIIRNSVFGRNGTKHDVFDGDGTLTGSWELLYGVGFRGNVIANRSTSSPTDFQYAFPGRFADVETSFGDGTSTGVASWGVNWFGFKDDNSYAGPDGTTATINGDYRPEAADLDAYTPSRLIGRGSLAVIDRTADNVVRSATFPAGALGAA